MSVIYSTFSLILALFSGILNITYMPITQSAIKALRQSARRHARNLSKANAYKKIVKEIKKLAAAGKQVDAQKLLSRLYASVDKAAKTHVIKKNKASRIKSRITKKLKTK